MNEYERMSKKELKEHLSNFLIKTWSVSKVKTFARNEKAFEMSAIYGVRGKSSASAISGSAYHAGVELFFNALKDGVDLDITEAQKTAYNSIDAVPLNNIKLQKTTPSIQDAKNKAVKIVTSLLDNFYKEVGIYTDDLKEVLYTEETFKEFLTINGVDIPMQCVGIVDLIIRLNDGRIIGIDHKSKTSFSDEKAVALTMGKQAIVYDNLIKEATGLILDEFWFIENKSAKNKNGAKQLQCFPIILNDDSRALHEHMLYEPLRRMLEAVSDPDYIYLINDFDNLVDQAEMYEFLCKTMTAEVDDFNIDEDIKPIIAKRLKKVKDANVSVNSSIIKKFQAKASTFITYNLTTSNMSSAEKINHILRTFSIEVEIAHELKGYSSKTYLLRAGAGTKISNIKRYKLDIANALNVPDVRISESLVMYENESFISVEAEFESNETLLFDSKHIEALDLPVGVDNYGEVLRWDLTNPSTPHMLVCGGTGSGKTVAIISMVTSALIGGVDRVIMFDPKFEFGDKFQHPKVSIYTNIEEIEAEMQSEVNKMNERVEAHSVERILMVFDEFADAVMMSRKGQALKHYEMLETGAVDKNGFPKMKRTHVSTDKSLQENLQILLQKGRSSGLNIISATQRASVKVITGDAKVNFPVILCFAVQKEVDSKVVLDEGGAELLKGKGDGLMKTPLFNGIRRFQSFYIPV